jgi:hypothetical protein
LQEEMKKIALATVTVLAVTGCAQTGTTPPLKIEPSPSVQQFQDRQKQSPAFPRAHPYEGEIGVQFPNQDPSSLNLNYTDEQRLVIEIEPNKYGTIPIPKNGRFTLIELDPNQSVVEVAPIPYPPELASERWEEIAAIGDIDQGIPIKGMVPGVTFFGFHSSEGQTLYEIRVVPIP